MIQDACNVIEREDICIYYFKKLYQAAEKNTLFC